MATFLFLGEQSEQLKKSESKVITLLFKRKSFSAPEKAVPLFKYLGHF